MEKVVPPELDPQRLLLRRIRDRDIRTAGFHAASQTVPTPWGTDGLECGSRHFFYRCLRAHAARTAAHAFTAEWIAQIGLYKVRLASNFKQ